jgi:hypothetical protein
VLIVENLNNILMEIVKKETYLTCKENRYFEGGIYVDYRDELSDSQVKDIVESENKMDAFYETLDEYVMETSDNEHWSIVETIEKNWNEELYGEFDEVLEEVREWIHETVYINFPYEHFLKKEVCVNVIVDNGDGDHDFTLNNFASYNASEGEEIEEESSILWLVEQQGYTKSDLEHALENYDEIENTFLKSVVDELTNVTSHMNALSFFVRMTLEEYFDMCDSKNDLTVNERTSCGLYDPWMGAGGMLEIALEKNITIPYSMMRVEVDGTSGYGVQEIYGVASDLWTETIIEGVN